MQELQWATGSRRTSKGEGESSVDREAALPFGLCGVSAEAGQRADHKVSQKVSPLSGKFLFSPTWRVPHWLGEVALEVPQRFRERPDEGVWGRGIFLGESKETFLTLLTWFNPAAMII